MKTKSLAAGVVLIGVLTLAGCSRDNAASQQQLPQAYGAGTEAQAGQPQNLNDPNAAQPGYAQPGQPGYGQPGAQGQAPAAYGSVNEGSRSGPRVVREVPAASAGGSRATLTDSQRPRTSSSPEYVTRKRSKKKSAAIVGGSAAAGAAVGAIAGGGKGAAIGAISGGAAGLVYDRLTHKKRERVQ